MKQIHSNVEEQYDWAGKFKEEFETLFNSAKELNIFNSSYYFSNSNLVPKA